MSKRKADVLQQKSPAEFFAENKNIAGFDNVSTRCVKLALTALKRTPRQALLIAAGKMFVHERERACGELPGCRREHWAAARRRDHYVGPAAHLQIELVMLDAVTAQNGLPLQHIALICLVGMCREEISQKRINSIRGIDNHERLDEELYHDFETDDARKVQSTAFDVAQPAASPLQVLVY